MSMSRNAGIAIKQCWLPYAALVLLLLTGGTLWWVGARRGERPDGGPASPISGLAIPQSHDTPASSAPTVGTKHEQRVAPKRAPQSSKSPPPGAIPKAPEPTPQTQRVVLHIEGMTCTGCAEGIEDILKGLPGVREAKVSYEKKQAVVTIAPTGPSPQSLSAAISEAGYGWKASPWSEAKARKATPSRPEPVEAPSPEKAEGKDDTLTMGRKAPPFEVPSLDSGKKMRLSDWKGQVVVLNFWASWCLPCRKELPELNDLYQSHRDDGVAVVGLNVEEAIGTGSTDAARDFAAETGVTFPVGIATGRVVQAYGPLQVVPATFVIDRSGIIRFEHLGYASPEELSTEVEGLANAER